MKFIGFLGPRGKKYGDVEKYSATAKTMVLSEDSCRSLFSKERLRVVEGAYDNHGVSAMCRQVGSFEEADALLTRSGLRRVFATLSAAKVAVTSEFQAACTGCGCTRTCTFNCSTQRADFFSTLGFDADVTDAMGHKRVAQCDAAHHARLIGYSSSAQFWAQMSDKSEDDITEIASERLRNALQGGAPSLIVVSLTSSVYEQPELGFVRVV